jgi:cation:H+ antiporter
MGVLVYRNVYPIFFLFLVTAAPIREVSPWSVLWTAPAILVAALMIAWAAESAQFFIAQGFALAILAWLQTLPEFAVEAVLAWKQQVPLLIANLTGALRLLTGLGWPVIYFTAAYFHRRRNQGPLNAICLAEHHSVEVVGLMVPLVYIGVITAKSVLNNYDAVILIAIYVIYLMILRKLPAEDPESIDELEAVPRAIVKAGRPKRIAAISVLFLAGGALIYFAAEPFLASLLALSMLLGVPSFFFIQWVAPIVSEFPEMASTIYFARTVERAPMALMNMVSSNINQWTLLVAMLPIVFSISLGHNAEIPLDPKQRAELLLTLAQAILGMMFLIDMQLAWWEAVVLFVLFFVPFLSAELILPVTLVYFAWAAAELVRIALGFRKVTVLHHFGKTWRSHVSRGA